jgi:hypothetical protein
MQNQCKKVNSFLSTNYKFTEKEIRKITPFIETLKKSRNKPGQKLWKTSILKVIKYCSNKLKKTVEGGKTSHVHESAELIRWKYPYYRKLYTDSM